MDLDGGKLPLEEAQNVTRQIALGMASAHTHKIVHGDLKPANIMVTPEGVVKIMDFGLAHREPLTSPTADTGTWETADPSGLSGTPDYMSPEQARSEPASSQSDVFALGLMSHEMVTGQKAINGGNLLNVLRQIDTLDAARYAVGSARAIRHDLGSFARHRSQAARHFDGGNRRIAGIAGTEG